MSPRFALLVIDMQNHFQDGMAEHIVTRLNSLIKCFENNNIPIIYTQHGHLDPEQEAKDKVLVKWWGADGSIRQGK